MAQKQSLAGIAFRGVQLLPEKQYPEKSVILPWFSIATQIQQRNALTTEVCGRVCQWLQKEGFRTCILKGQANHRYYDAELRNLRTCGDIDIWVAPDDKANKHPVKSVLEFFMAKDAVESLCYLHIESKPVRSVPVEVHLRPSFLNSPMKNRRFQRFFGHGAERFDEIVIMEEVDGIAMPMLKVNDDIVFQLNHIYRHLIDEGVGLRQVLDYYFLLHKVKSVECEVEGLQDTLRSLGLWKFAGALMYVLHEVFAMPQDWMICPPSPKDGQFLLNEMMTAGNFGHHDPRMANIEGQKGKLSYQVKCAWRRFIRNTRFFTSYPEEVFWEPFARLFHFWWRKFKLWRV